MTKNKKLSHIKSNGEARMVDVSKKNATTRTAKASCKIKLNEESYNLLLENNSKKGNVFAVAKVAGIMAAKKTDELIPLCHQIELTNIEVDFSVSDLERTVTVQATASAKNKTGVEMEAMVAVSISSLTVYDMLKAADKKIVISNILLEKKTGGKSGNFGRNE